MTTNRGYLARRVANGGTGSLHLELQVEDNSKVFTLSIDVDAEKRPGAF